MISVMLILAITYITLWLRMLDDPIEYTGTDYVPFYAASLISKNEGPSQIYNLELQLGCEETLGNFIIQPDDVRIFLNPPFIVPLVNLVSFSGFLPSLVGWEILNFIFLLVGTYFVFLILRDNKSEKIFFLFLLRILSSFPGYKSLVIGQNSSMLFLGASMRLFESIKKRIGWQDWV